LGGGGHCLLTQLLDLLLQFFVFRDLAAQEAEGDPAFLLQPLGGQDVGVRDLVVALPEPFVQGVIVQLYRGSSLLLTLLQPAT